MLSIIPGEHGVHGVSHLVEEVVDGAAAEQRGRHPAGRVQVQHQDDHRVLVGTVGALPATADGEVAVLSGDEGMIRIIVDKPNPASD